MPQFLCFLVLVLAFPAVAHEVGTDTKPSRFVSWAPYEPSDYDLGVAVGMGKRVDSYAIGEVFGGLRLFQREKIHHFLDLSFRMGALNRETNYAGSLGWRFQWVTAGSSWGPYVRPFVGGIHYIFSGRVADYGMGGVAGGIHYFLHPAANLRVELGQVIGPLNWTYLTLGATFKVEKL